MKRYQKVCVVFAVLMLSGSCSTSAYGASKSQKVIDAFENYSESVDSAYYAELLSASNVYQPQIDLVNNGIQFSKTVNVSTTADSSGPIITNLAVTPTSISSGQAISVTMKATDTAGVRGCGATVYNVNGIDVVTNSVSTLNPSTGVYTVDIVMNSGNNPGSYTVRGFCNDNNLNRTTTS